jgi:hypothetical protein
MPCWPFFFHEALRLLLCPCLADLLAALVAAGAYPEHSTTAKLKITSFFMAERTGSPQKKIDDKAQLLSQPLSISGPIRRCLWRKLTSDHHPMFGCRYASSLLRSSGLPKCNEINKF